MPTITSRKQRPSSWLRGLRAGGGEGRGARERGVRRLWGEAREERARARRERLASSTPRWRGLTGCPRPARSKSAPTWGGAPTLRQGQARNDTCTHRPGCSRLPCFHPLPSSALSHASSFPPRTPFSHARAPLTLVHDDHGAQRGVCWGVGGIPLGAPPVLAGVAALGQRGRQQARARAAGARDGRVAQRSIEDAPAGGVHPPGHLAARGAGVGRRGGGRRVRERRREGSRGSAFQRAATHGHEQADEQASKHARAPLT